MAELREQYTYNIHPFSDGTPNDGSQALGRGSSDEEEEDFDLEGAGCLGMLLPFSDLTPSSKSITEGEVGSSNACDIAAASPGVFDTEGYSPEEHALKPKLGRVQRELPFLQKQYSKMRQMQQQVVVVFSEAAVQNIKEEEKRKSIPTAINHLLVSATKKRPRASKQYSSPQEKKQSSAGIERVEVKLEEVRTEAKGNTYKKESMAHLNSLFRGNQKENKAGSGSAAGNSRADRKDARVSSSGQPKKGSEKVSDLKANSHCRSQAENNSEQAVTSVNASKLEHMGLNGEVSSMEAPPITDRNHKPLSVFSSSRKPAKVTVVNASLLNGQARRERPSSSSSAVEVLNKNSPSVLDGGRPSLSCVSRGGKRASEERRAPLPDSVSRPWLLNEDNRCTYPSNFNPFPQRKKAPTRSKILYGSISEKGAKRMEAFHGRSDIRQPLSANGTADTKRS